MSLKSKSRRRKFELKFCLPFPNQLYEQWAEEVVETIEDDTLLVFDPKDRKGLDKVLGKDGSILIWKKSTEEINAHPLVKGLSVRRQIKPLEFPASMPSYDTDYAFETGISRILFNF